VPNSAGALAACSNKITVASANVQDYCYDASSQQANVDLSGFSAACSGSAAAGNLVMTQEPDPGKYTFVLTWGATPLNLDAHMRVTNHDASHQAACWYSEAADSSGRHIIAPCWNGAQERRCVINGSLDSSKVCTNNSDCPNSGPCACVAVDNGNTFLDVDAQNGYGPETITMTVHDQTMGEYYVVNKSGTAGPSFRDSKAQVRLWGNGCNMQIYEISKAINYSNSDHWSVVKFVQRADGSVSFTPDGGTDGSFTGSNPPPAENYKCTP
jgi:hypothetical protein